MIKKNTRVDNKTLLSKKKSEAISDIKIYKIKSQPVHGIPIDLQKDLDECFPDMSFSALAKQGLRELIQQHRNKNK
ncbi:hypothetical protein [Sulfurospirillum arcachonense]|uniref:hypothetical protein n=1 Tax=Sulfurospirillum arcachonense TaxID=57666 RepID=UPI00046877F1|nr:hypothetical protein [Sulfurospirillum arcachonense]